MREPINLYSLVIRPPEWIITLVRDMKSQLRNYVNWYPSCDSDAHLTILEFEDEAELNLYLYKIEMFCEHNSSQIFNFSSFDSFGESTFFISPGPDSKARLIALISDFYSCLGSKGKFNPHITIGRRLHERNQMARTKAFFANAKVDFTFCCDALTLREFDPDSLQYSTIKKTFKFSGKRS